MFVRVDEMEGIARKGKKTKRGSKKIQAGVSPKKKKVRSALSSIDSRQRRSLIETICSLWSCRAI
jgi:hypothetical protein